MPGVYMKVAGAGYVANRLEPSHGHPSGSGGLPARIAGAVRVPPALRKLQPAAGDALLRPQQLAGLLSNCPFPPPKAKQVPRRVPSRLGFSWSPKTHGLAQLGGPGTLCRAALPFFIWEQ